MAQKKQEQLRDLDTTTLVGRTAEMQEQLFRLRFQMSMGQSEGLKKYRELKKDRARALGALRERELKGEAIPAAPAPARAGDKKRK